MRSDAMPPPAAASGLVGQRLRLRLRAQDISYGRQPRAVKLQLFLNRRLGAVHISLVRHLAQINKMIQ